MIEEWFAGPRNLGHRLGWTYLPGYRQACLIEFLSRTPQAHKAWHALALRDALAPSAHPLDRESTKLIGLDAYLSRRVGPPCVCSVEAPARVVVGLKEVWASAVVNPYDLRTVAFAAETRGYQAVTDWLHAGHLREYQQARTSGWCIAVPGTQAALIADLYFLEQHLHYTVLASTQDGTGVAGARAVADALSRMDAALAPLLEGTAPGDVDTIFREFEGIAPWLAEKVINWDREAEFAGMCTLLTLWHLNTHVRLDGDAAPRRDRTDLAYHDTT